MSNNRPRNKPPVTGKAKTPKQDQPVRNFAVPAKKAEPKVVLFTVGDKPFKGPKEISPSFRVKVMRTFQKKGEELAVLEIMDYLLGDQYDELLDLDLPEEILGEIHTLAIAKVMGIEEKDADSPN